MKDTLATLLRSTRMTRVVDIGANPIDGEPPYGSADLALKCIISLIEMRELPASSSPDYVKSLVPLPA